MKLYPVDELQNMVNEDFHLRFSKLNEMKPAVLYEPVNYSLNGR